jgi:capsid portal protein
LSQDVTFATANVSAYLAETQVFMPERAAHDEFFNKNFVNHPAGLNLKTVRIESTGPRVTNPDQVIKSLTAVNAMGAVTPRTAIKIVNETMQLSLDELPEKGQEGYEEWMDMPMQIAQRKVMADQKAQQTGEGSNTHAGQESKTPKVKETEATGSTGAESQATEHGTE